MQEPAFLVYADAVQLRASIWAVEAPIIVPLARRVDIPHGLEPEDPRREALNPHHPLNRL